jgi:2-hydroxychromene-2-carboxylate isomerase
MDTITVYIDYQSLYAYLAKDPIYEMAAACGATLDWRPYTLDIPSYLGSAELDDDGAVLSAQRTAHQWRKVRYAYMDCRREANRRGLILRGTRKIWDSSLAAIGLLWARRHGEAVVRGYSDQVFERFWRRELDIEDAGVIEAALRGAGAERAGFSEFLQGDGRRQHDAIRAEAEAIGVFGVPTLIVRGQMYWGREHLAAIRAELLSGG